jgi:hypothetical protein
MADNAVLGSPGGPTDENGWYATTITALSDAPVTLHVTATVILPGETVPSIFSRTVDLDPSQGTDVSGYYVGFVFNDYAGKFEVMSATVVQSPDGIHMDVATSLHSCTVDADFSLAPDGALALENILVQWDCPIVGGFPITGRIRGGGINVGQFLIQYGTPTAGTTACEVACDEHAHCFAVIQGQMADLPSATTRIAGK